MTAPPGEGRRRTLTAPAREHRRRDDVRGARPLDARPAREPGGGCEAHRTRPTRCSTAWTRLTGVLVMVSCYAALIAGVLPLPTDADVRDLRLALVGCAMICVLLWITASVRAPRADTVVLDKPGRRDRRPSRVLPVLLALLIPSASGAALVQAVGPDGEEGRWTSEVHAAGGGAYEIPVDKVLTRAAADRGRHQRCARARGGRRGDAPVRPRRPQCHRPRGEDGRQAGRGRHGGCRIRSRPSGARRASRRPRLLHQRLRAPLDLGADVLRECLRRGDLRDEPRLGPLPAQVQRARPRGGGTVSARPCGSH